MADLRPVKKMCGPRKKKGAHPCTRATKCDAAATFPFRIEIRPSKFDTPTN